MAHLAKWVVESERYEKQLKTTCWWYQWWHMRLNPDSCSVQTLTDVITSSCWHLFGEVQSDGLSAYSEEENVWFVCMEETAQRRLQRTEGRTLTRVCLRVVCVCVCVLTPRSDGRWLPKANRPNWRTEPQTTWVWVRRQECAALQSSHKSFSRRPIWWVHRVKGRSHDAEI